MKRHKLDPTVAEGPYGTLAKAGVMTRKYQQLLALSTKLQRAKLARSTVDPETQEVLVTPDDALESRMQRTHAKMQAIQGWFARKARRLDDGAVRKLTRVLHDEYVAEQEVQQVERTKGMMEEVRAAPPLGGGKGQQQTWLQRAQHLAQQLERDGFRAEAADVSRALRPVLAGGALPAAVVAARDEIAAATSRLYTTLATTSMALTRKVTALGQYVRTELQQLMTAKGAAGSALAALAGLLCYSDLGRSMCHTSAPAPRPSALQALWYFFQGSPPPSLSSDKGWFCNQVATTYLWLVGYQNGGAALAMGAVGTGTLTALLRGQPASAAAAAGLQKGLVTQAAMHEAGRDTLATNAAAVAAGDLSQLTVRPTVERAAEHVQSAAGEVALALADGAEAAFASVARNRDGTVTRADVVAALRDRQLTEAAARLDAGISETLTHAEYQAALAGGGTHCKPSRQPRNGQCPPPSMRYDIPQADGTSEPCCTHRATVRNPRSVEGFQQRLAIMCRKLTKVHRKRFRLEAELLASVQLVEQSGQELAVEHVPSPAKEAKLKRLVAKQAALVRWMARKATIGPHRGKVEHLVQLEHAKLELELKQAAAEHKKQQIANVTQTDKPTGGGIVRLLHALKEDGDEEAYRDVAQVLQGGGGSGFMAALSDAANANPLLTAAAGVTAAGVGAFAFRKEISNAVQGVWTATTKLLQWCSEKIELLTAKIAAFKLQFGALQIPGLALVGVAGFLWYSGIGYDMCHPDTSERSVLTAETAASASGAAATGAVVGSVLPGLGTALGAAIGTAFGFAASVASAKQSSPDYGWFCQPIYECFQVHFGTNVGYGGVALSALAKAGHAFVASGGNVAMTTVAGVSGAAQEATVQKASKMERAMVNAAKLTEAARTGALPTGLATTVGQDAARAAQFAQDLGQAATAVGSETFALEQHKRQQQQLEHVRQQNEMTVELAAAQHKLAAARRQAAQEQTERDIADKQAREDNRARRAKHGVQTMRERVQEALAKP